MCIMIYYAITLIICRLYTYYAHRRVSLHRSGISVSTFKEKISRIIYRKIC